MKTSKKAGSVLRLFKLLAWFLAVLWTMVIAASLFWNMYRLRANTLEAARIQARAAYEKDVIYRRWNAGHGGVYVPTTNKTQPNRYLSDILFDASF